jgi:hypothetical protein
MAGYPYLGQVADANAQKSLKAAFDLIGVLRAELDALRATALTRGSPFNAQGERISRVASPQAGTDAVNADYLKRYVAAQISSFGGSPGGVTGGFSVFVDPAGALDGVGTLASPLAVRVDGVSVTISGANELEAPGGGGGITELTGDVTAGPGSGSEAATLAATGVSAATYGDSTHVAQVTVDAKGRLTAAANVLISANRTEQTTTATGTQNDFSLSAKQTYLRVNNASAVTFTGFTIGGNAPVAGDSVLIENIGASTVKVAYQTGSTAAYQVITESAAGQIIGFQGCILCTYDDTTDRWRLTLLAAGEPITVAYDATHYTALTGTWTVASGDVRVNKYVQQGRLLTVIFGVVATTPSNATAALDYAYSTATGFTFTSIADCVGYGLDNGNGVVFRVIFNPAAGNILRFVRMDGANISASTDLTNCTVNSPCVID